jgi:hypothetical protein
MSHLKISKLLLSSLNVRNQVSHPYTTGKTRLPYILTFMLLHRNINTNYSIANGSRHSSELICPEILQARNSDVLVSLQMFEPLTYFQRMQLLSL